MVRYWRDNPEKWQRISMEKAMEMANQGYFVVAGWVNPSGQSGHVVVVVPGPGDKPVKWGGIVPNTMDTGLRRRNPKQLLSESFDSEKKSDVVFYYYK